jgi:hypothetical protein
VAIAERVRILLLQAAVNGEELGARRFHADAVGQPGEPGHTGVLAAWSQPGLKLRDRHVHVGRDGEAEAG